MRKTLFAISCFLLISLSCERPESSIDQPKKSASEPISRGDISIEEAKNYFTNTVLRSTASARKASERKYQRDIDWSVARKVKQENGLEVIAVPVIYKTNSKPGAIFWDSKTPDDQKHSKIENALDIKECLLTFKDKAGQLQTQLVQYISTKEYKQQKKGGISKNDFTGWMMAMSWDEQPIIGYQFKKGKDIKQLTPVNSTPGGRMAYCDFSYYQSISVSCYSCGSNCTACDVGVSGGYQGYCTDPSSNSGTDPNTYVSYGGNGIYYYTPPNNTQSGNSNIITNNLTTPCLRNVMNKVQNAQFNAEIQNILQNFNASTTLNFSITERNLSNDDRNAETIGNSITLNSTALANASQEFIAKVIYHEVLHVYLGGSLNSDHQTMAANYVSPLMNTLTSLFPNLSFTDAQALSWSGLKDTNAWSGFSQIGKNEIFGIATQHKNLNNGYNHQYGTSCN